MQVWILSPFVLWSKRFWDLLPISCYLRVCCSPSELDVLSLVNFAELNCADYELWLNDAENFVRFLGLISLLLAIGYLLVGLLLCALGVQESGFFEGFGVPVAFCCTSGVGLPGRYYGLVSSPVPKQTWPYAVWLCKVGLLKPWSAGCYCCRCSANQRFGRDMLVIWSILMETKRIGAKPTKKSLRSPEFGRKIVRSRQDSAQVGEGFFRLFRVRRVEVSKGQTLVASRKGWEKIIGLFGLTNVLDGLKYVETIEFTTDLRDLIFDELKMKSELADDLDTAKEIYEARGDWVLR
ncbi:hypothetical protein U1Q18_032299 [Sarracenia purpurea var. burkii]